jgi:hypothetical protein
MNTEYSHPKLTEVVLGDPMLEFHKSKDYGQNLSVLWLSHRFDFCHNVFPICYGLKTDDLKKAILASILHDTQDLKPTGILYGLGYSTKRIGRWLPCGITEEVGKFVEEVATKIDDLEIDILKRIFGRQ